VSFVVSTGTVFWANGRIVLANTFTPARLHDFLNMLEQEHWTHHTSFVAPDVKIHYVQVKPTEANGFCIILIHGYPQTWYSFRNVMQPLADLGYNVIAVDYRGAGDSNHPAGGYDKMTMAKDIHTLYHDKLQIDKAIVFGTDIGSMVAVSLALQFEEDVLALITGGRSRPVLRVKGKN
jgi:pimeloyl-ACP methyl ester carboxylesterase